MERTCASWCGLEELRDVLRCFLSRHCRDPNEIEDVVQETFLRAAHYRANLCDDQRLRSWTMRIALNVLTDRQRRSTRLVPAHSGEILFDGVELHGEDGEDEDEAEPEFRVGRWLVGKEAALSHLGGALASLRQEDRRVLDSYYGGRGSCRETAEECEIPTHLVKVRLFRARQRLVRAIRRRLALGQRPRREVRLA